MRNFHCLAYGLDVKGLSLELAKTNLWNQNSLRTNHASGVFRDVDDIWLRMNDLTKCRQADKDPVFVDHRESIDYPAMKELVTARLAIMALMNQVGGTRLGRCIVSRLKPGKRMLPHKDIGEDLKIYYDNEPYYSRYHIVAQGLPGSLFRRGDEEVCMRTGEVWWFRNDLEHEVINNSADDRVHMVVDIRS